MRRSRRPLIAFVVTAALVAPAGAGGAPAAGPPTRKTPRPTTVQSFLDEARERRRGQEVRPTAAKDHIVASFSSDRSAERSADRNGWDIVDHVDGQGTVLLDVPSGETARGFAEDVDEAPATDYAEPDFRVRPLAQSTDWGVAAIGAPAAHGNGLTGAGVTVAVVDSGVDYLHEDLDANMWTNAAEAAGTPGIDDDGNGYVDDIRGWDFIGNFFTATQPDDDPMDDAGHGTHVAGIVAAEDNGAGVLGTAPDATIMPVKVLDSVGAGWDSTVAKGIRYAVDTGADIVNLSLGSYQASSVMADAVRHAAANDVTVVAAAGNEFFYSIPSFPAAFPSTISVAAAARADESRVWWSNWGNVDFLAPGEDVRSSTPTNKYQRFSGTSMASPHVAGALALVLEANPSFDPEQLEQALASTASDRYMGGKDEVSGSGFPDVGAATGTLPTSQVELYRDPYLIPSDGTEAVLTLRMLDAAGAPIVGATGTFSTDVGQVTPDAFTTDGDGEATTALTVEDHFGVATVSATPDAHPARDIRVIVEDDRVRVDDAMVGAPEEGFEEEFEEDFEGEGDEGLASQGPSPAAVTPGQGEDVQVVVTLGNHRFEDPKRAAVEFSVTDPSGNPVPELAGQIEPALVGSGFFGSWMSQTRVASLLLTIPEDAAKGRYELTVTATTEESGKEDTRVTPFWIGVRPDVLIVREGFGFNAETLNYFDFDFWGIDWGLKAALDGAGRSFDVAEFFVEPADLKRYSAVIWMGAWDFLDTFAIDRYLAAGGNILLSGEQWATLDRLFPETVFRDRLHLSGLHTTEFPDRNNQIYPREASGSAGGLFDGETLDIDSQDLGSSRDPSAVFTDELVLQNAGPETTPLFAYPSGVRPERLAGAWVDDGKYRVAYLGFGIEAIDDQQSTISSGDLALKVLEGFAPPPTITRTRPSTLSRRGGVFRIIGTGFQRRGDTVVKVRNRKVKFTVKSRTVIEARLPRGFPRGRHPVTVINPFGDSVTKAKALRVS